MENLLYLDLSIPREVVHFARNSGPLRSDSMARFPRNTQTKEPIPAIDDQFAENGPSKGHQGTVPQTVASCPSCLGAQSLEAMGIQGLALPARTYDKGGQDRQDATEGNH